MEGDVAFGIAYDHSFFEEIKLKCGYLVWCDVHINPLHIAVQSTPYLYLVSHGRIETKLILNVLTAYCRIFVSCMRVIVFVILINVD